MDALNFKAENNSAVYSLNPKDIFVRKLTEPSDIFIEKATMKIYNYELILHEPSCQDYWKISSI